MRYLKTYEDLDNGPQVGDYVICTSLLYDDMLNDFLLNNIGQVKDDDSRSTIKKEQMEIHHPDYVSCPIFYDDIPNILKNDCFNHYNFRWFKKKEVLFYSSNREECELFLVSNNYNI